MSQFSWCAKALVCILATSTLQGCLLTRVMDSREQLCDVKPAQIRVATRPGSGLSVMFEKPTLTDRDVVWIVGFEPTVTAGTGANLQLFYEARPLHRPLDRASGLVVRLDFVRTDGEYKLAEVAIPEKFNVLLSPALLDAVIKIGCKAKIGIVPPRTTFDLASLDRATIPSRESLREVLGTPTETLSASNTIAYRYCLAPCAAKLALVAHLNFAFGDRGELERTDASYFRYALVVDLLASAATATIELH